MTPNDTNAGSLSLSLFPLPFPPPPQSLFTLRATIYYGVVIVCFFLRGYVSHPQYFYVPIMAVYLYLLMVDKSTSFPSVKKTDKWLETANYVEVTSWFVIRRALLQDVEDSINASLTNTDIVTHKMTPCEFHVYYNECGHFNHYVYRVFRVIDSNVLTSKYLISCENLEGVNAGKQFHGFVTRLNKKYYFKPRMEYMRFDNVDVSSVVASEDNIKRCIMRSLELIGTDRVTFGLRMLLDMIDIEDNRRYNYLFQQFKIVITLENIAFKSKDDDDRLMAITALQMLSNDRGMFVGTFFNDEYVKLVKPLYEHKSGPYSGCFYYHGRMEVNSAKELVSSTGHPGFYLIFSVYDETALISYQAVVDSPFNSDTRRSFVIRKITYDEDKHVFVIQGRQYKSVDDYIMTVPKLRHPYMRPVKPLLIAMEALKILSR